MIDATAASAMPRDGLHRRVIVGLSGGVDSSVAALLLKRQGCDVQAVFMKNWEEDDRDGYCAAAKDLADARDVSRKLDIGLQSVNFSSEYWERVFVHFLDEYRAGRTPNPDVLCNQEIKFRAFLDHALALGADRIATGHYARVTYAGGRYRLLKGRDRSKDQSYFLYPLGQEALGHTLFPLGDLHKSEVRRMAAQAGLATHAKKDSTGICFIGERPFRQFLAGYLPARPGEMRTPAGEVVGSHAGLMYYTLGQRRGLEIGGRRGAGGEPWFVAGKDLVHNVLVVCQGHDHPLLYSRALSAAQLTWTAGHPPPLPLRCNAKVRYRQPDQGCSVSAGAGGSVLVAFDTPQRAVTPGQSVVFYAADECLGGGIITATEPAVEAK